MTAFYTMRQITLTFLGEPRTKEAEHAQETPWTMTAPLVILAFFAVTYGWVGIPEHFPLLGGLVPNWFHEFVGGTLAEHPEALEFSLVPLAHLARCSARWSCSSAGLSIAMSTHLRKINCRSRFSRTSITLMKLYDFLFVKPAYWFAETCRLQVDGPGRDRRHPAHLWSGHRWLGAFIRNKFDLPVINRFFGDGSADVTYWVGGKLRAVQTGRVQQYLMFALVIFIVVGAALYFFCWLKEYMMNFIATHLLSLILFFPCHCGGDHAVPAEG